MEPKEISVKKENMDLIYGLIIGDGSLYKHKRGNAMLDICHCVAQKEYIEYKAKILSSLCNINCEVKYKPPTKNHNYGKYRIITPSNVFWTKLLAEMYCFRNTDHKKKKKLTKNLIAKFSLRTLCLWYMDDGHNNIKGKFVNLATHDFTDDEAQLIQSWIYDLTGCSFSIYHRKSQPFLVSYRDSGKFKDILNSSLYIPESMKYKFI